MEKPDNLYIKQVRLDQFVLCDYYYDIDMKLIKYIRYRYPYNIKTEYIMEFTYNDEGQPRTMKSTYDGKTYTSLLYYNEDGNFCYDREPLIIDENNNTILEFNNDGKISFYTHEWESSPGILKVAKYYYYSKDGNVEKFMSYSTSYSFNPPSTRYYLESTEIIDYDNKKNPFYIFTPYWGICRQWAPYYRLYVTLSPNNATAIYYNREGSPLSIYTFEYTYNTLDYPIKCATTLPSEDARDLNIVSDTLTYFFEYY